MTENAPALAPHQLGNIGIFLLGHQAAAGGAAIREADEAKLLAGPKDHLLAEAAQMHHHQAGRRTELHREVAVTHRIEAVGIDLVEAQGRRRLTAIDRHRGSRQGCSS